MESDMHSMIPPVSVDCNTAGSDIDASLVGMAYDKAGDAQRLKEIYQRVVDGRGESRAQFGKRSGLGTPGNISHYLNGKNSLNVESARKFAMYIPCKIEDFSLHWARKAQVSGLVAVSENEAYPHSDENHPTSLLATEPRFNKYVTFSGTTLKIPLLSWGRIDLMSEANEKLELCDGVEFVDADGEEIGPKTKFVDMPDDSMSPRLEEGDRLTLEPDWSPESGEIVLIRDKSGAHYIRHYKYVKPGHFIAEPHNKTDYEALDSIADGIMVVAVVKSRREFLAKRRR